MRRILDITKEKYLAQLKYAVSYILSFDYDQLKERYILLPPGIPTRGEVINAIIREEYPEDRMEAVINNYLLDETDESAIEEFDIMQAFRSEAKILADEILERINNNEV